MGNGFVASIALEAAGGVLCVGSGVCEAAGLAVGIGVAVYTGYELGKLIGPVLMGRIQSNEYTDWARAQVQAGNYKTVCDALAAALAAATDSATQKKIVEAQKFAKCRNVGKRR